MNRFGLSRRASLKLAGTTLGALLLEAKLGRLAYAKSADTLVIGMDISDTNSFDPGHQFVYSAPITMRATYETLVTMALGPVLRRCFRCSRNHGSSPTTARRWSSICARM